MNRTYYWGLAFYLAATSTLLAADKKPVIYVANRDSAQLTTNGDTTDVSGGGTGNSMAAATIKDLNRSCPDADITLNRQTADYVLLVGDTHGFPGEKDKQAVVATADGKVVFSSSARLLENAVKDACGAIAKDWSKRTSAQAAPPK